MSYVVDGLLGKAMGLDDLLAYTGSDDGLTLRCSHMPLNTAARIAASTTTQDER
jgi:hypothetical protein